MSLYIFSTFILGLVFLVVFGSWWHAAAPFATHLTAMLIAASVLFSGLLMAIALPILNRPRSAAAHKRADSRHWDAEVSSRLTSPAAVIEGHAVTFANQAFLNSLGMSGMADQIIGMPLTNVVYPADHALLASLLAGRADAAKAGSRLRLLCLDGSVIPAQVSLSPLGGQPASGRTLLQFASLESAPAASIHFHAQFNYYRLLNRMAQTVFQLEDQQRIAYLNPAWESMLDYAADDGIGRSLLDFVHPEDRPLIQARLDSLARGKRHTCIEQVRFIKRNGDPCWVELRASTAAAAENERSSVIGTLTDVHDARQVDAQLRSNRQSLSSLLNNVPCMLYRRRSDGGLNFDFVSDSCTDITGYEAHELLNNPALPFSRLLHADDAAIWQGATESLMHQPRFQAVYRLQPRHGAPKWVCEQGMGIYASTGELLAVEGFIAELDMTGNWPAPWPVLTPSHS